MKVKLLSRKFWLSLLAVALALPKYFGLDVDVTGLYFILAGVLSFVGVEGARDLVVALKGPPIPPGSNLASSPVALTEDQLSRILGSILERR
ncbi:MAG: hypothetical protein HY672_04075 [Chloroflexi bacterium]|nr:hypothetical protein [Chloroflexota bacterium]